MTWQQDVQAVVDEAAGLMELVVLLPTDAPELVIKAAHGDVDASRILGAARDMTANVRRHSYRKPAICGCCPRPVRHRDWYAIAFAMPRRDDVSRVLATVICRKCGADRETLNDRALSAFQRMFPDARKVTINSGHAPGHA